MIISELPLNDVKRIITTCDIYSRTVMGRIHYDTGYFKIFIYFYQKVVWDRQTHFLFSLWFGLASSLTKINNEADSILDSWLNSLALTLYHLYAHFMSRQVRQIHSSARKYQKVVFKP